MIDSSALRVQPLERLMAAGFFWTSICVSAAVQRLMQASGVASVVWIGQGGSLCRWQSLGRQDAKDLN